MRYFFITLILCASLFANNITSIKSDFTQTITSAENDTLLYKGNFVATQYKAYWNYTSPTLKEIFFSQTQVIVVEPDLEQAIITNLDQVTDISTVLNDAIRSKGINENSTSIKFMDINYIIDFKDDIPTKISYLDELENKIVINLHNTQLNQEIDDLIFKVELPKHYDLIQY